MFPYPLVMTNIAMENGPFIDGLPIKNEDFPWRTVSYNHMVNQSIEHGKIHVFCR